MTVDADTGEVQPDIEVGVWVESKSLLDDDYPIGGLCVDDTGSGYRIVRVHRGRVTHITLAYDDATVLSGTVRRDVAKSTKRWIAQQIAKGDTDRQLVHSLFRLESVLR